MGADKERLSGRAVVVYHQIGDLGLGVEGGFVQEADRLLGRLGTPRLLVGAHERELDVVVEESAIVAASEQDLHVLLQCLANLRSGHRYLLGRAPRRTDRWQRQIELSTTLSSHGKPVKTPPPACKRA